jgi:hypothetical protein
MRLQPHTSSPDFALTVTVSLSRHEEGFLLEHLLDGPGVDTLALAPRSADPRRHDELWKHTCFEAFFAVPGSARYYEFNGSPSGDWALYAFDGYRQGMAAQDIPDAPVLRVCERQRGKLRLAWHIPYFTNEPIDYAGITAVLQSRELPGISSYWALAHVGERPDFHLAGSFIYPLMNLTGGRDAD